MASSKQWFSVIGSSIVRRSNLHKTSNLINPIRSLSYLHIVRERSCSSVFNQWPEWVAFVDHLKSNGYILNTTNTLQTNFDTKLLNTAGLSFAHQRFDLFQSLSLRDIQTVVGKGCPTLFGKVIDSAKRLRAHLHLDEGKVCGACNRRGRCNRYCELLADDEASAQTVDVVRVLLMYALDPNALSEVTNSSDRVVIEKSVRRLLSQLIELSDTLPAPKIPITSVPAPPLKKKPPKFDDNDWKCSRCSYMNFAKNIQCRKCQADGPNGEWICPGCGLRHFSSKTSCFQCGEPRPPIQLKPGEWQCSSCSYINWRQNKSCIKCNMYHSRSIRTLS